jgi:hypothetical protein
MRRRHLVLNVCHGNVCDAACQHGTSTWASLPLSLSLCHEICSAERCTRGIQTHRANACPTRSTSTFLHHRCGLGSDGSSSAFFDPNTRVNRVKNETSTKFHNGGQHDEREPHGADAHGTDREAQLRCCGHADLHGRDAESEWEALEGEAPTPADTSKFDDEPNKRV